MSGAWERNPIDILIATPISGSENVYYEWSEGNRNVWLQLPQGQRVAQAKFPEPCIDISRDKAVNIARQNGARWLFFLDADVIPPADVIPRLLAHNKPIVSGLYVRRHLPPFNEMLWFRKDGLPGLQPIRDGDYKDGELIECDAVGTGCVLINMNVFEQVKPWQLTIDGQQGRPMWFLWTEWRLPTGGFSEDFAFFTRCRQQGIPVYCDTSVKCKHLGPVRFAPSGNNQLKIEFLGT